MTKVFLTSPLHDYQQATGRAVEQIRREYGITGLQPCTVQMSFQSPTNALSSQPCLAGLLQPPRIDMFPTVYIRNGQIDGLLQFWTWGDFGPLDVSVNLLDEQGNLIESDYALPNPDFMNHWAYIIELEAGDLHSLIVQAIVTDRLGGLGMQTATVSLED